jgi:hypothetical protein
VWSLRQSTPKSNDRTLDWTESRTGVRPGTTAGNRETGAAGRGRSEPTVHLGPPRPPSSSRVRYPSMFTFDAMACSGGNYEEYLDGAHVRESASVDGSDNPAEFRLRYVSGKPRGSSISTMRKDGALVTMTVVASQQEIRFQPTSSLYLSRP